MLQYKDSGIILKSQDFFETDRILTILTEKKGKVRAVARGIRKPTARLSGSLEPLSYCNLILVEGRKDLDIISGAEIIASFKHIRHDLRKTATAYFLTELVDKLVGEKEKQPAIFWQLKKALEKMDSTKPVNLELLADWLVANTLSNLGYHPEIKICQGCHNQVKAKSGKNYFSPRSGGTLCSDCVDQDNQARLISLENLKVLKLLLDYDLDIIDKISPKNGRELSQILEQYLEFITERKINSSQFLKHLKCQKD